MQHIVSCTKTLKCSLFINFALVKQILHCYKEIRVLKEVCYYCSVCSQHKNCSVTPLMIIPVWSYLLNLLRTQNWQCYMCADTYPEDGTIKCACI